jgi:hypothetical protein
MDRKEIEQVIADAIGNPESGILRDNIGVMARALFEALNPKKEETKENRVLPVPETRKSI